MHLCTSEDPLTGNAGVVIKGLITITNTAAKSSYMNKLCNQPMLLPDSICVLLVFKPLQYIVEMWVMRDTASSV